MSAEKSEFDTKAVIKEIEDFANDKAEVKKEELETLLREKFGDHGEEVEKFLKNLFGDQAVLTKEALGSSLAHHKEPQPNPEGPKEPQQKAEDKKEDPLKTEETQKEEKPLQNEDSIVLPKNTIKFNFTESPAKQNPLLQSKEKKRNMLFKNTEQTNENLKKEIQKTNENIYNKINQFKNDFFKPQNKISTPRQATKKPYYTNSLSQSTNFERGFEDLESQPEYVFEKKNFDIKDPKQKKEYIEYIKADLRNLETKKKEKNTNETDKKYDSIKERLAALQNKLKKK